jgi:spore coat protein CotF
MTASQGNGSTNAFASLQNADVTTISSQLMDVFKQILPPQAQTYVLPVLESMSPDIEKTFQSVLNQGYTHMFIASAVIASIGILVSLTLKKKEEV